MNSALQLCVWHNHCEAVAWLLDVGHANLEFQDEHGHTALLIDIVRVSVEQMRNSPLLRSTRVDVSSFVEVRYVLLLTVIGWGAVTVPPSAMPSGVWCSNADIVCIRVTVAVRLLRNWVRFDNHFDDDG